MKKILVSILGILLILFVAGLFVEAKADWLDDRLAYLHKYPGHEYLRIGIEGVDDATVNTWLSNNNITAGYINDNICEAWELKDYHTGEPNTDTLKWMKQQGMITQASLDGILTVRGMAYLNLMVYENDYDEWYDISRDLYDELDKKLGIYDAVGYSNTPTPDPDDSDETELLPTPDLNHSFVMETNVYKGVKYRITGYNNNNPVIEKIKVN